MLAHNKELVHNKASTCTNKELVHNKARLSGISNVIIFCRRIQSRCTTTFSERILFPLLFLRRRSYPSLFLLLSFPYRHTQHERCWRHFQPSPAPPQRNLLRLSISVADGVPAWTALAVSMLPSPQTWNLEAMRSMRPLGWNILLAGAVLG